MTCVRQTEWPAFRHKSLLKSNLRRITQHQPPGTPEEPCTFVGLYPRSAPGKRHAKRPPRRARPRDRLPVPGARAARADQATAPPVEQIRHLAEAGLLGLTTPPEYGGLRAHRRNVVRDCLAAVAAGCGVTAFVYFQHLVGCRHLAGCANGPLKERLLPALAAGRRFCSLAFSHLRRPGPPILRVRPDGAEWVFDGTAPG